jgi:hypothetical protein
VAYSGSGALLLAVVLFAIGALLTLLGSRLKHPIGTKVPGRATAVLMVVVWALAILSFLVAVISYAVQIYEQHMSVPTPSDPITPVTYSSALVTFVVIAFITRKYGLRVALLSAFVGAASGPMIFELPFDLIVINRTVAIPPSPELYRLLFFLPLFVVEISTISLLTFSPRTRVSKYTAYSLAGVFAVFGIWALIGFPSPISPAPIAFNAISKVLSFVTAITLFWEGPRGERPVQASTPQDLSSGPGSSQLRQPRAVGCSWLLTKLGAS